MIESINKEFRSSLDLAGIAMNSGIAVAERTNSKSESSGSYPLRPGRTR